jgi:hypothetical protein
VIKRTCNQVLIDPINRTRTRYFRHATPPPPTRDNIIGRCKIMSLHYVEYRMPYLHGVTSWNALVICIVAVRPSKLFSSVLHNSVCPSFQQNFASYSPTHCLPRPDRLTGILNSNYCCSSFHSFILGFSLVLGNITDSKFNFNSWFR